MSYFLGTKPPLLAGSHRHLPIQLFLQAGNSQTKENKSINHNILGTSSRMLAPHSYTIKKLTEKFDTLNGCNGPQYQGVEQRFRHRCRQKFC
jgi:hypothetical protein